MSKSPFESRLWTARSVSKTQEVYAQWADTYDVDVMGMSYATPARIAAALAGLGIPRGTEILDFGCGTGLSGMALRDAGFEVVDGTDISPQMLTLAAGKTCNGAPLYRRTWQGVPGELDIEPGRYELIVATGVISLGAAPPETLQMVLERLGTGGILAFSYNDPTLADERYTQALEQIFHSGMVKELFRQYGPHLSEKVTGSDVIVLQRL